jgi:hypothetical protein
MVNCINEMYDGITFCTKCGEDEVTDFVEQMRDVRHGCTFSPCLFNIFINDIINYISKDNLHALTAGMRKILGLLFADDLAITFFYN